MMSEYLTLNNHNRKEVYNYSIKQVFYYYNLIVKLKNNELQNNTISRLISSIPATTGNMDSFNDYIKRLN